MLWSFAFAQPLFDILADSPEFFVARENTRGDIILLAVAVTLVPPTMLILVELVFARLAPARRLLHLAFVGLLTTAIALQVLKDLSGSPGVSLIPISLALGAGGAFAYHRGRVVRAGLGVLTPLPLVFVIVFLLFSPVSKLVLPQESEASGGRAGPRKAPPIVMLVFDELSGRSLMDSGRAIDDARYPNFARLARDATWYRNATTVADFTTQAVPAILTGKRPEKDQLPIASDHPDNLFSFLRDDYALNVHEPVTDLCPPDLCAEEAGASAGRRWRDLVSDLTMVSLHRLLPEDLSDDLPAVDRAFSGFERSPAALPDVGDVNRRARDRRTTTFEAFLRTLDHAGDRPSLHFVHTDFPHVPWDHLPSGQRYLPPPEGEAPDVREDRWTDDRRSVVQAHQRYLLQVGYADRLLGRLLDRLRSTGVYERSLLIVTADHGSSFRPGEHRREISPANFEDIASVPLIVKAPRERRARVDDSPASSVDILPTIADYTGTRLSWRSDGRSLRDAGAPARRRVSLFAVAGPALSLPVSEFRRRRDASVDRDTTLFGSEDGWGGVFAPGDDSGMIGMPVEDLQSAPPLQAQAVLDDPRAYESVPKGAPVLPVLMTGELVGELPAKLPLAVAVNGRIAAITESFGATVGRRFDAIVDPTLLRAGSNEISLFAIRRDGADPRLAALAQGEPYKLVERDDSELIISPSGLKAPVVPQLMAGYVDKIEHEDVTLRVRGWSASPRAVVARRVVVFAEGRFLAATEPRQERPDVATSLGPSALSSGFAVRSHLGAGQPIEQDIRVFALFGDRAAELGMSR